MAVVALLPAFLEHTAQGLRGAQLDYLVLTQQFLHFTLLAFSPVIVNSKHRYQSNYTVLPLKW